MTTTAQEQQKKKKKAELESRRRQALREECAKDPVLAAAVREKKRLEKSNQRKLKKEQAVLAGRREKKRLWKKAERARNTMSSFNEPFSPENRLSTDHGQYLGSISRQSNSFANRLEAINQLTQNQRESQASRAVFDRESQGIQQLLVEALAVDGVHEHEMETDARSEFSARRPARLREIEEDHSLVKRAKENVAPEKPRRKRAFSEVAQTETAGLFGGGSPQASSGSQPCKSDVKPGKRRRY